MRFAIEGRIDSVGTPDIFLFLNQTQRTSVVAFERPDQETKVFFVDGHPVWCLSSRSQLQIDGRLAVGGSLKLRDIEGALKSQKAGRSRIPQALIAEGMATAASLEADLRALAVEALRDLAEWTTGTFTVFDGVIPPPWAHTQVLDFSTLLMEALRGQCEEEALQKEFVSRRGVLRARPVTRSTTGLNDAERAVFVLVNGARTIEDLVARSGLGEMEALSAMHVLCALHLTDLLPPDRSAKPGLEKATVPTPAPSPRPTPGVQRSAATDESVESSPAAEKRPGPRPAPAAKAAPKPRRLSESTEQLPVLTDLPPPKARTHSLRILSEGTTEDIALTTQSFAIGRHPRNDLVLKDPRISSFHCRIEREGDRYAVVDLKSRNGTLLKGARIDRAILKHDDVIQIGNTRISYTTG